MRYKFASKKENKKRFLWICTFLLLNFAAIIMHLSVIFQVVNIQ